MKNVFHVYRSADANKNAVINKDVDEYNGWLKTYQFDSNGYGYVHDKSTTVGVGGIGSVYDYDVNAGMVYIEEDTSEKNLPRELEDADGKTWYYKGTRIETEYVWRDDGIEYRRHVSDEYKLAEGNATQQKYRSHPGILGRYLDVNGLDQYNGFLEFFVYNIYSSEPIDVPVEKVWKHENGSLADAPDGASVTVTLAGGG